MKNFIIIILSLLTSISCAPPSGNHDEISPIVKNGTPFISGIIESSYDTLHHYSQIVVGYVSDARFEENYMELKNIPRLYNPTLWTQIVRTSQRFELQFIEENQAEVFVRGPLGDIKEKTIQLTNENWGIYGDVKNELNILPDKIYELTVLLSNNRKYISWTRIPDKIEISIPDSIDLDIQLLAYEDGTPREESFPHKYVTFLYPKGTFLLETQLNTSIDRELLYMDQSERFLFSDRSEFLRSGIHYGIWKNEFLVDSIQIGWWRNLSETWVKNFPVMKQSWRFTFYNNGMWRNHQNLDNYFVGIGDEWEEMYLEFEQAAINKDSTYLFRVSTINKLDEQGNILPRDQLDAIGFFAGSYSVYKKTTVYPIRNFDLDSVFTANGL